MLGLVTANLLTWKAPFKASSWFALQAINAFADIIESVQSKVDPRTILNINAFDVKRILENEPDFLKVCKSSCM